VSLPVLAAMCFHLADRAFGAASGDCETERWCREWRLQGTITLYERRATEWFMGPADSRFAWSDGVLCMPYRRGRVSSCPMKWLRGITLRDVVLGVVCNLLAASVLWTLGGAQRNLVINGPKEVLMLLIYLVGLTYLVSVIVRVARLCLRRVVRPWVLAPFALIFLLALPVCVLTFVNAFTDGWGPITG
jgi:hypothetical protein